jgi:type 1 glutamine amidotransferase
MNSFWRKMARGALALMFLLGAGAIAGLAGVRAQDPAPPKKIVFWAGPKEHGAPGRHEYERDLTELAWQLEHATNLRGVKTLVKVVTKPPRDISELDDADALVIFGNGAWLRTETGILFPQDPDTDLRTYPAENTQWLNKLDALIKQRKLGLAIFHYTMWNDNAAGRRFLTNWFGGLWIPNFSHNPVDTWTVSPLKVSHPILNGVQPWTYRDEMFTRYFLYTNPRRTDLLQGMPTNANNGGPDPVSWAFNRPDGGRSVVWGGSDFHDNQHNVAEYRRFLLNAIIWIAGMDVPAGGVSAPAPPADDPPIPVAPAGRGGRGGGRGAAPGAAPGPAPVPAPAAGNP